MKAVYFEKYGSHKNLCIKEIEKPEPKEKEVVVKVKAVSLNSSDIEFLTAKPGYIRMWGPFKPKFKVLGSDISGVIDSIGPEAKRFNAGDKVFGDIMGKWGGFAEYVSVPEKMLTKKPDFLTFEEAAAIPQAALVALQGLRDKGRISQGEKVLINGAGGGAGSFAVQLAKYFGCNVTAVDKDVKFDLMRNLGADLVIDYRKEDFTESDIKYDVILDFVASHSVLRHRKSLSKNGRYVMVGGSVPKLLQTLILGSLISLFGKRKIGILGAKPNKDIDFILDLISSGKLKIIIDKRYAFEEIPDAMKYLSDGEVKGKLVAALL